MKCISFYNKSALANDYSIKRNRVEEVINFKVKDDDLNSTEKVTENENHFYLSPFKIAKQQKVSKSEVVLPDKSQPLLTSNEEKTLKPSQDMNKNTVLKSITNSGTSFFKNNQELSKRNSTLENNENDLQNKENSSDNKIDQENRMKQTNSKPKTKVYPIFNFRTEALKKSPPIFPLPNQKKNSKSPISARTRGCSSSNSQENSKQLIIDAGQKKFGVIQCNVCCMQYNASHPTDQKQHSLYHQQFLSRLKFPGWKNERVTAWFLGSRIVKILPSDPKFVLNKAEHIREIIDADLGFQPNSARGSNRCKIFYLHIENDEVTGVVIAEPISTAFRLLSPTTSPTKTDIMSHSLEPVQVACGISRIWTYAPYRRQGIATKLIDEVRKSFTLGSMLEIDEIAFSHPSESGRMFAAKYCKTEQFLTYNYQ